MGSYIYFISVSKDIKKHPLQNRTNVQIKGGGGQRPFEQCSKKLHFSLAMASLSPDNAIVVTLPPLLHFLSITHLSLVSLRPTLKKPLRKLKRTCLGYFIDFASRWGEEGEIVF